MKLFLVFICVVLQQVSGFHVEENGKEDVSEPEQTNMPNGTENQMTFQKSVAQKSDVVLGILTKCLFKQIIEGMQYAITSHIEKNNNTLNNILGIKNFEDQRASTNFPTNLIIKQPLYRQKRELLESVQQQSEPNNWNKCVSKSDLDQHTFTESKYMFLLKQELAKLHQLVRLLQDQQYVLNILNDMNDDKQSKIKQNREFEEFLQFLKTYQNKEKNANIKPEGKSEVDADGIELSITKLEHEVAQLKQIINSKNIKNSNTPNIEQQLSQDLKKQKQAIQELQKIIETMQSLKTIPTQLNKSEPKNLNDLQTNLTNIRESETIMENIQNDLRELEETLSQASPPSNNDENLSVVGAPLPHFLKIPNGNLKVLLGTDEHNTQQVSETSDQDKLYRTNINKGPKARAEGDEFLENFQKLFGISSEPKPEVKDLNSNNIEAKLQDLEREIKLASKVHKLQKQLKNLQDSTDFETKTLDDDDDIKAQLKKIQHQIKNLHPNKPQKKGLDEEDELQDRLKELQNAIDNLKPKDNFSNTNFEGKDSTTDFQTMLSRLLNLPAPPIQSILPQPATNLAQQFHLTPAQIQLLKTKILSMNRPGVGGQINNGETQHGLFGTPAFTHSLNGIIPNGNGGYTAPWNLYPSQYGYQKDPYSIFGQYDVGAQKLYGSFGNPYGPIAGLSLPYGYEQYRYQPAYNYKSAPFATGYGTSVSGYNFGQTPNYGLPPGEHYGSKNIPYESKTDFSFPESKEYAFLKAPTQYSMAYIPNLNHKIQSKYTNNGYANINNQPIDKINYPPFPISKQTLYQHSPGYNRPSLHSIFENLAGNSEQDTKSFFPEHEKQGTGEAYKPAEKTGTSYGTKPYSNSQQSPPSNNVYTQEKVEDLKAQISNLENIINNLNGPEYIHQAEDQDTVYKLDKNINDLKSVINNLSQEAPQNTGLYYSDSPPTVDYLQPAYHNVQKETYATQGNQNEPLPQKTRKIRAITKDNHDNLNYIVSENLENKNVFERVVNLDQLVANLPQINLSKLKNQAETSSFISKLFNSQPKRNVRQVQELDGTKPNKTKDAFNEFLQQLSDLFEVYRYLSENLEKNNNTNIHNETLSHIINRRVRQVPVTEDMLHGLLSKITFLMNSLKHITHEILKSNCSCTEKLNTNSKSYTRAKRQAEDDGTSQAVAAMTSFFTDVLSEVKKEEKLSQSRSSDEGDETNGEDFQDNQHKLKQKLEELKKQLDTKIHLNHQLPQQRAAFYNPSTFRKSKGGSYYQQPVNYQTPQYFQPYAYHISDYAKPQYYQYDSDKSDKEHSKVKTSNVLDKVFNKIVDKIVDKTVYAIPKVIRKLLSTGIENLLGFGYYDYGDDKGYDKNDYYGDNYSVQKGYDKLSLFAYIPMLIIKVCTNLSYFIKTLQKNKFVKIFLVPGIITALVPGLVIFLVWWLTSDDSYAYVGNYNPTSYDSGYSNNYGGGNDYSGSTYSNSYNGNYRSNTNSYETIKNNPANNYNNMYNYIPSNLPQNKNRDLVPLPSNPNINLYKGNDVLTNYFNNHNNKQGPYNQNPNSNSWISNY